MTRFPCDVSFVIPVFNEAEHLGPLSERIARTCDEHAIEAYEILFVENGSVDDSEGILRRLHEKNQRVKMIQLSRNFGYQGAISAGLAHARGEWTVILDGDQQDPPELMPVMLRTAREGYDVVYGVRTKRHEPWLKRIAYAAFYRLWRATAEIHVPLNAGDFCLLRRNVVDSILSMPERHRFVRGLRAWSGFRQIGIPYERAPRAGGESKFGLTDMISLALEGLLSYSTFPLRLMTFVGLWIALLSFVVGSVQACLRILNWLGIITLPGILPPGLTQINLLVTFLLGFNILCVGILGEYVGRIYGEVKQRPLFIVRGRVPDE